MRERELLDAIRERSSGIALDGADLLAGPGDDCAVVRTGSDTLLVTVDQLVEGRHYESGTGLDLIARKSIARSISDVAAMAGEPVWATATGLLPDGFEHGDQLFDAMKRWAEHWGAPLIGGDIAFGPGPLVLTVTVVGRCVGTPLLRSGARVGDGVYVSGPIGGSFESGRHLTFEPRLDAGRAARDAGATALIDISDGLGIDAHRVGVMSNARLRIAADAVPLHSNAGPWQQAFAAGEDYELLACGPTCPEGFTRIGEVTHGEPGAVIVAGGAEHDAAMLGWDHGEPQG
ncbi:MAG: thiamine-phosphate kinase [Planctomycetota bacterium]